MEDLNLTDTESRYFGDLFLCCDEESNGKVPILKATELFRSSNIPDDLLKQIMEISVAPNTCSALSHLNRRQFYSSLKLIAAHQQNMSIKPDLLTANLELSLPRFLWALDSNAGADLIELSNSPKEQHISKRDRNFTSSVGAYEPIRLSNLSDSEVPLNNLRDNAEALSTDSEIESESSQNSRGRRGKNGSPWSTASDSPTPTNSVAEQPHPVWENSVTGRGIWPSNTAEEHTQLLGTEEESSDRHSSDDEGENEDLWSVSSAQAKHYAAQFRQLRPEKGLISGHIARLFFEKSRLPVSDLRKIWQLADVNKDGALDFDEFCIAMHLIVLRRNNVPVPDTLPDSLAVDLLRKDMFSSDTDGGPWGSDMISSGTSADFNLAPRAPPDPYEPKRAHSNERRPSASPPKADGAHANSREWTKFVESPTNSVSSPGPKPVNFDFAKSAVERDPKIFHPVALRVTPDAEPEPRREEPRPIQRPQGKKSGIVGAIPPPPSSSDDAPHSLPFAHKKDAPPPPPPRPLRNHARSSSLDLNRLQAPPQPPPRHDVDPPRVSGAFELYRRSAPAQHDEHDVRSLLERNAVLYRMCRALQAELADVQADREALRHRLDDSG